MHAQGERRAVVTGATSGIGEAIARSLAASGWTVVMAGRSGARLGQARGRIAAAVPGADLRLERADLSLLTQVRELAGRLAREPLPDVVISNAAVIAPLDDITPEGFHRSLAVNYLASYVLLRSLAGAIGMRPARFVIVGASPAALARRLAGTRITVNGAHPGIISGTGLGRSARGPMKAVGGTLNLFTPEPASPGSRSHYRRPGRKDRG